MPTLQLIITDAGRQAIVDATNTGTLPVVLNEVALGTGKWAPDATATQLQAELKRINAVGGLAVADDTIHITCTDDSTDAYALGEFGIYTDGGVLFAIYSDAAGITDKADDALLLLAADAVLTSVPPGSVTVNGIGFSNPPATELLAGIAKVATQPLVDEGLDDQTIVTPLKLAVRLAAAINNLVDAAPGTLDTLNELAAALGDDPNFSTTILNALSAKLDKAGGTMSGHLTFSSGQYLYFEDGDHSITHNDGKGNFNIRVGHQPDETYSDGDSGAIHVAFSHETSSPSISFHIGEDPTGKLPGDPVVFDATFEMDQDGNFYIQNRKADAFDTGTIMLFQQSAAPTGWTKLTDHNDKALRVVSGNVVNGGALAFSTALASRSVSSKTTTGSIGNTTLGEAKIPAHSHTQNVNQLYSDIAIGPTSTSGYVANGDQTSSVGGGESHSHSLSMSAHNHTIDMRVSYVDVIRARKD